MAQGGGKYKKPSNGVVKKKSNPAKHNSLAKATKKGSIVMIPNKKFRDDALTEKALSKAIAIANEQKVSSKLVQAGGKLNLSDLKSKGKEMARDLRRAQVKKKVGRVEEKLNALIRQEEST